MNHKELQTLLIRARKEKQLSHEQITKLTSLGITRQYYGMNENGNRKPSVNVAQAIAKVLS